MSVIFDHPKKRISWEKIMYETLSHSHGKHRNYTRTVLHTFSVKTFNVILMLILGDFNRTPLKEIF